MSPQESIPKKSTGYLFAESVFYEQFNKVEFFFEDEKKEELYYVIVKKLFPIVEFNRIFTLNGKNSVIEKAEKSLKKKNRVFIVDKDFDDILGLTRSDLPNLFYLEKYSIENYYFEENAILQLIISQIPSIRRYELRYNHRLIIKKIVNNLKPIVCCFYIAHKNRIPNLKSVSLPLEMFTCNNDGTKLDKTKMKVYRSQIASGLKSIGISNAYLKELRLAKSELKFDEQDVFNNLPGKHCIMLLIKILKKKYSKIGNLQFDRVCYALAVNCIFNELSTTQKNIYKYLEN
jgi:hypothetical protein